LTTGVYRLRFATAAYFASLGVRGFYPEVQVVFQIDDPAGRYHVPLLLSTYGYSTYRGS
jgi:5-hydroxyisourate hydrolase